MFTAMVWLLAAVSPQAAEDTVKPVEVTSPGSEPRQALRYHFQAGQFLHYEVLSKISMKSQYQQTVETVRNETQSWKQFRVITVDDQGMALLEPVVDRALATIQYNDDSPIKWDSQESIDKDPNQVRDIRQTIGKPITRIQVNAQGQIQKVTLLDGAPAKLAGADAKDARQNFLVTMPVEPVGVGATWKEQFYVTVTAQGLPPQRVSLQRQYQLTKLDGNVATISLKTQLLQVVNNPQIHLQLLNMTPTGEIEFDLAKGHLLSQRISDSDQIVGALGPQSVVQSTMDFVESWRPSPAGIQPAKLDTSTQR
ncbi:hypothetical protein GC163_19460 [bacterium]|nr:hypothetical protein [bacterium]